MMRLWKCLTRACSWVTISTVVPRRLISLSRSTISKDRAGSILPVGSSATIMLGLFTRARARLTRCCSPPESSVG